MDEIRCDDARALRNPADASRQAPGAQARTGALSAAGFAAAVDEITGWPGYAATPLRALPALAAATGVGEVLYKDESGRFGLGSFKALGGAYAVGRLLCRRLAEAGVDAPDLASLRDGRHAARVRGITVTCATDGNHGRSVAWGAQLFGCRCVIFVHPLVSVGRRAAIARWGAEVVEVPGNYDDSVRHAAAHARAHGWTVVSDTAYPGYDDIPRDVMHGYGVMAAEIAAQAGRVPTHVFVQSGVGALPAALCADFRLRWGASRPRLVVVEPLSADCAYRSLAAGAPRAVAGEMRTVMAGLACGELSALAWPILRDGAWAAIAVDDRYAVEAIRRLARPAGGDVPVVAGETGAAGAAALLAVQAHGALRRLLALDAASRVLLIGSEGDTDPELWRALVGLDADAVRQGQGPHGHG